MSKWHSIKNKFDLVNKRLMNFRKDAINAEPFKTHVIRVLDVSKIDMKDKY